MPRKERMEYAGGVYHVMDRGDRLEAIYEDDRDRVEGVEGVSPCLLTF